MTRKPTIQDIARISGLGAATVDRVLHERPNVSARARDKVTEAAEAIGYPLPASLQSSRSHNLSTIDLGFVLHKRGQAFYQNFAREIEVACALRRDAHIRPHIRFAASQSPEDFAKEIRELGDTCQAVAATAINHISLSRLVDNLADRNVPVFSMLNDFAGSAGAGYLGLDNIRVGRLAGWMMATRLQRSCKVGVFVGGTRWHGQALRETGFRSYLREFAPQISVLDTAVNLETRQLTYEATLDLLNRVPDLGGLYIAGGGMEGAIAALREARPAEKVALIVNERTAESTQALADRYVTMVIATPLAQLCGRLIESMLSSAWNEGPVTKTNSILEPQILLPESV